MSEERFTYLLDALQRPSSFSTSHLAGLATTLAHSLAISVSTNDGLLYFWKSEWLIRCSIECDQEQDYALVGLELFFALLRHNLTHSNAKKCQVTFKNRDLSRERIVMVLLAQNTRVSSQRTNCRCVLNSPPEPCMLSRMVWQSADVIIVLYISSIDSPEHC
jgi:hypothetical protein